MRHSMMRMILLVGVSVFVFYGCKKDDAPPTAPTVTTATLTNITTTSAAGGGTITSNGGATITASGIVLSKVHSTPTLVDTVITGTTASGSFTSNITNLDFATTYYIRAYATNSAGTGYGNVITLNTTNDTTKVRFTYNGQTVSYGIIISPVTGRKWMDRNLGASRVATAYNDDQAYGDLIQWGRPLDGHQLRTSGTTTVLATTDIPGHGNFIIASLTPFDWRNPQNDNLWQGATGTMSPCPDGWHLPLRTEWQAETGLTNSATSYAQLKMTVGGYRPALNGIIQDTGGSGWYWTGQPNALNARYFSIQMATGAGGPSSTQRANGLSCRCIKD